jgi:putative ABC transport system permease protein
MALVFRMILLTSLSAARIMLRHRLRTGLAMLGIVIGIGAVIALAGIGQGAKATINARVASMGTNVIIVLPGATSSSGVRGGQGTAVTLTVADAIDLKRKLPAVAETAWSKSEQAQVVHGGQNWNADVKGISPGYLTIRDWSFSAGGPINQTDMDAFARVALVGQTVVENLYASGEEPIGSTIRIKNVPFQVVGVLAPKGQSASGKDQDDVVFIPFTTAQRKVMGTQFLDSIGHIYASATNPDELSEAVDAIRQVLRIRHRLQPDQPDDFTIRTQADVAKVREEANQTLMVMLFAVASISLLVGGIGIMNIMLVSVTERTREIGIRMAVGAKRRQILLQFLIETVLLSLAGGLIGTALGIVSARVTSAVAGWPTIITSGSILLAVSFSLAVGLFFGLYPANKAARLNPIDALRYE